MIEKSISNLSDEIFASLLCGICHLNLDKPNVLPCGHYFCEVCITKEVSDRRQCPICKIPARIKHLTKSYLLDEIVHTFTQYLDSSKEVQRSTLDSEERSKSDDTVDLSSHKQSVELNTQSTSTNMFQNSVLMTQKSELISESPKTYVLNTFPLFEDLWSGEFDGNSSHYLDGSSDDSISHYYLSTNQKCNSSLKNQSERHQTNESFYSTNNLSTLNPSDLDLQNDELSDENSYLNDSLHFKSAGLVIETQNKSNEESSPSIPSSEQVCHFQPSLSSDTEFNNSKEDQNDKDEEDQNIYKLMKSPDIFLSLSTTLSAQDGKITATNSQRNVQAFTPEFQYILNESQDTSIPLLYPNAKFILSQKRSRDEKSISDSVVMKYNDSCEEIIDQINKMACRLEKDINSMEPQELVSNANIPFKDRSSHDMCNSNTNEQEGDAIINHDMLISFSDFYQLGVSQELNKDQDSKSTTATQTTVGEFDELMTMSTQLPNEPMRLSPASPIRPSIVFNSPVISINWSQLSQSSLTSLFECQKRGWIDIKKSYSETGYQKYRALIMDCTNKPSNQSSSSIKAGNDSSSNRVTNALNPLKFVKRTAKYILALCEGIRVLDSSWLQDSLASSSHRLINPIPYEVDGTIRDAVLRASYISRTRPRDKHGRSYLLQDYDFTLVQRLEKRSKNANVSGSRLEFRSQYRTLQNEKFSEFRLTENQVRWMIDRCGGRVVRTVKTAEESQPYLGLIQGTNIENSEMIPRTFHINLAMFRKCRDTLNCESTFGDISVQTTIFSLAWLLDAICNQRVLPPTHSHHFATT